MTDKVTSYIEGDDLKSDNPSKAIEMFEKVVELETNLGDQVKWYVTIFITLFELPVY